MAEAGGVNGYVVKGPNGTYMTNAPYDGSKGEHPVGWKKAEGPEEAWVYTEKELIDIFGRNREEWNSFQVEAIPASYDESSGVKVDSETPIRAWSDFLKPQEQE